MMEAKRIKRWIWYVFGAISIDTSEYFENRMGILWILAKKRRAWLSIGRPSPEVAELSARRDLLVVTLGAQTAHRH